VARWVSGLLLDGIGELGEFEGEREEALAHASKIRNTSDDDETQA